MLKILIFLFLISCVPQGGNITLGPQTQGSLGPGPEINTISVVGSQLIIDGYNFSGITYVTLKDPVTDIVKPFEVKSATLNQLISESIDTMSVPVNKVLELILSNAYGQTTYPVTFTLQPNAVATGNIQDNAVTTSKIPNGGVTRLKLNKEPGDAPADGDVLSWDTGSNQFVFAPYGGGGGGGGGVASITRGVGIANSGTTITASGPISVDISKTGDPLYFKIPYFNNFNELEIANSAEILFSDPTASFSLLNNNGSFVITRGSTATDYFILDDTGDLTVTGVITSAGSPVCTQAAPCGGTSQTAVTQVTASAPLIASGSTEVNISAKTGTAQGDLVLLGAPGSFLGVGKLPSVDGSGLLGVITDVLPGTATTVSKFLGNATVDVKFGDGFAQRWQRNLDTLGTLNTNDNYVIIGNGTSFEVQGGATLRTSIGAQEADPNLTEIAGLSPGTAPFANMIVGNLGVWSTQVIPDCASGNVILGNGSNFYCSDSLTPISGGTLTTFNQLGLQIRAATTAGTPTGELHFLGSNNTNYVGLKAASGTNANTIWTLPAADGTSGYVLSTNGGGQLSWVDLGSGNNVSNATPTIDNTIAKFDGSSGKIIQGTSVIIDDSNNVSGVVGFTSTGNMTVDINTLFVDSGGNKVGIMTATPTEALDVRGDARLGSGTAVGNLKFYDIDGSNYVALQATGTVATNTTWTLPAADGANGQVLTSNGAGILSWTTPATQSNVNTQAGTSYTLLSTDCGNTVTLNNAAAITVTMPNLFNGCRVDLIQLGAGQVTVSGGVGPPVMVLQNAFNLFKSRAQYSVLTVTQLTNAISIVSGDVN